MRRGPDAFRRGFTLLEMLVTLVVVGLVAGVLSQALFQLSRIERLMSGGQLQSMAEALRVEWVRTALAALQPGEAGGAERFAGAERELRGLSAAAPRFPGPTLAGLHLSLRFNPEAGVTELLLADSAKQGGAVGPGGDAGVAAVLLSWPGPQGRFRYQDAKGAWHASWPPPQTGAVPPPGLPSMIMLETGHETFAQVLAAPLSVDLGAPSRRTFEQL
jgi:prepilin-type N-terminal cleavage/methylation domain-containing protein